MNIEVSLTDSEPETVEGAKYYQIEDGWFTFKDDDNKSLVAYPEKRVTRIKRIEPTPATQVHERDIVVNLNNPLSAKEVMKAAGVL